MVGPWVDECKKAWIEVAPALDAKKVALDLRGITFLDAAGTQLLREIYSATHAEILSDSPLTKYFAERVTSPPETDDSERSLT